MKENKNIESIRTKVENLINIFDQNFLERQDSIRGAVLAAFSGEHVLFLGPPGTAKSLLARKMCEAIKDANFFYYLLTRFTVPEEIFGPLSLKALEEDKFSRKIEGYLPTAHLAFLDEIFKANSSILNSLLTIINERLYHNGAEIIQVPLISVFGASNELPEEDENLDALYDRFLFRHAVQDIEEGSNFKQIAFGNAGEFDIKEKITLDDIKAIQDMAKHVKVPDDVQRIIMSLRSHLKERDVYVSDRRWKKIVQVLKVAAVLNGREHVDATDVLLCQHMCWTNPNQRQEIRDQLISLVISGGIPIDDLEKEVNVLKGVIEDDLKPLASKMVCDQCGYRFSDLMSLNGHSHDGFKCRMNYCNEILQKDEIIDHFKSKHNKDLVVIASQKKKLYKKSFNQIKKKYDALDKEYDSSQKKLESSLRANQFLTEIDRNLIIKNFKQKFRDRITEIGKIINQIGKHLS